MRILSILALSILCASTARAAEQWTIAREGRLAETLVEQGELAAVVSRSATAPFDWRADLQLTWIAPEGSMVAEGDLVARFEDGFLREEIDAVTAKIAVQEAELRATRARQASAMQQLESRRQSQHFSAEQNRIALETMEHESESVRMTQQLDMRKSEIAQAEAETKLRTQAVLDSLELAKAILGLTHLRRSLDEEHDRLAKMQLKAPTAGMIIHSDLGQQEERRRVRLGDTVPPGSPIVLVPDLSKMEVSFPVHEADRERVAVGMSVSLRLLADPSVEFRGQLREVSQLALASESDGIVKSFEAIADVAAVNGVDSSLLRPGMSAAVTVVLVEHDTAVVVDSGAIFEREGVPVVFPRSGWPEPREITLRQSDGLQHIVSSGVESGEELSLRIPEDATDIHSLGTRAAHRWKIPEVGR